MPQRFRRRSRYQPLADKPDWAKAKRHERLKFSVIGGYCSAAKTPRQCQAKCVREGDGMTRLEDCCTLPEGGVGVVAGDHTGVQKVLEGALCGSHPAAPVIDVVDFGKVE